MQANSKRTITEPKMELTQAQGESQANANGLQFDPAFNLRFILTLFLSASERAFPALVSIRSPRRHWPSGLHNATVMLQSSYAANFIRFEAGALKHRLLPPETVWSFFACFLRALGLCLSGSEDGFAQREARKMRKMNSLHL